MTLMKLRLDFVSEIFLNILGYIWVFIHRHGVRGEAIYVIKSKVIQPQPKYKTRDFENLIRLLRDIH